MNKLFTKQDFIRIMHAVGVELSSLEFASSPLTANALGYVLRSVVTQEVEGDCCPLNELENCGASEQVYLISKLMEAK